MERSLGGFFSVSALFVLYLRGAEAMGGSLSLWAHSGPVASDGSSSFPGAASLQGPPCVTCARGQAATVALAEADKTQVAWKPGAGGGAEVRGIPRVSLGRWVAMPESHTFVIICPVV